MNRTALTLGILGAAALALSSSPSKAEGCIDRAARALALKAPELSPDELADLADGLSEAGHQKAAECVAQLAKAQAVSCKHLLIGPFKNELRAMNAAQLRKTADFMHSLGADESIVACLRARAAQLEN